MKVHVEEVEAVKLENGLSTHDIKIVASSEAGVAYWDSIAGALKLSERVGMPVELTHNGAKVSVDWEAAVKFFAEQRTAIKRCQG